MRDMAETGAELLAWYDRHARDLPWRVGPADRVRGVRPDPYAVWLSEVMLQQTTVAAVRDYFRRFMRIWPDVSALAAAEDDRVMGEWAGLGYYARARNLLKCARVVAGDLGGQFPGTYDDLIRLPGIGPYTAAAIAAIAFDRPETVVDGNVERVMARFFAETEPFPSVKPVLRDHAIRLTPGFRPGDHAQALMDLGATVCTPRSPDCGICPIGRGCLARQRGLAADLPARAPKQARPIRQGTAWIGRRADGAWLVERRPGRGLLGGMLGWPGTNWPALETESPPIAADWRVIGEVRHTFTHFHLILSVESACLPNDVQPARGFFLPDAEFRPTDLPSVMRKAHALALSSSARRVVEAEQDAAYKDGEVK